ncbi:E3 ubiquitin-protein ligase RDUF1 [Linum grandiflorum]
MSSPVPSYWCYRCNRFVRVWTRTPPLEEDDSSVSCPNCEGGFVEEIENHHPHMIPMETSHRRRIPPATFMSERGRGRRSGGGDRSPMNPVIVMRGGADSGNSFSDDGGGGAVGRGFELYYDDGGGSGLRPLPPSMSEFLLGSGFERLMDQLSQIELNGFSRHEHPPASKAAIESLPVVTINSTHTSMESHCAVCKEPFESETEARQMP